MVNRGTAYGLKGDYQKALEEFKTAVSYGRQNGKAINGLCYTRALLGDMDGARKDCARALEVDPNEPYILDSRGFLFFRSGDFRRALADYNLALEIDPVRASTLFARGVTKIRLGQRQEGEQDMMAARAINPKIDVRMKKIGLMP